MCVESGKGVLVLFVWFCVCQQNEREYAVGGVCVRERGRGVQEDLLGADVGSKLFVGEKREVGEAVVGCIVGFISVDIFGLDGDFGQRTDRDLNVEDIYTQSTQYSIAEIKSYKLLI